MNCKAQTGFLALAMAALLAPVGLAHQGTVVKFSQPIGHLIPPGDMMTWGENIWSDVDWNKIMESPTLEPNWVIADDFRDPFDTPVLTVRWWGSYNPQPAVFTDTGPVPPGPGVEDGYLISFFTDVPAVPGQAPSHPGALLASYVLPFEAVKIKSTDFRGWDEHPIWEYEANLQDAHLDHAVTPFADENGFNQRPGEIYWISIVAEVGHRVELVEGEWRSVETGKVAQQHYWGWHTSPINFIDDAAMTKLFMPGNEWQYGPWGPIDPLHGLDNMAFELLTIPEPAAFMLVLITIVGFAFMRQRRRG